MFVAKCLVRCARHQTSYNSAAQIVKDLVRDAATVLAEAEQFA